MWMQRAAIAAVFLWAGLAQAQVEHGGADCVEFKTLYPWFLRGSGPPLIRKFFADLQFQADPAQPPAVEIVYTNLPQGVHRFFIEYLESARWVCPGPVDVAHKVAWSIVAGPPGGQTHAVKFKEAELPLGRFLAMAKEVPDERVSFNFDEMGCPFKVRWTHLRPAVANRAYVIDARPQARRDALLRWLASLEADLPNAQAEQLIGESITVRIPCGRINLAPPTPAPAASSAG